MPEDISAMLAKTSPFGTSAHKELDVSNQDTCLGAHGTIGEQKDETHYDQRDYADDDLEKGKIHFPTGRLYGRDKELAELRSVYSKVEGKLHVEAEQTEVQINVDGTAAETTTIDDSKQTPPTQTTQIVFLGGLSGSGKSALVDELFRSVTEEQNKAQRPERRPLCGSGKFVQFGEQSGAPFSALFEALAGWTSQLLERAEEEEGDGTKELRQVRSNLKDAGLGPDDVGGKVLLGMFPALSSLLLYADDEDEGKQTHSSQNGDKVSEKRPKVGDKGKRLSQSVLMRQSVRRQNVASLDALKIVLLSFVVALCRKHVRPVMMFIDDLQWADEASLDVICAILTNKALHHFLFVGAYRCNEVNGDDHPLPSRIEDIVVSARDGAVRRMEITNLAPRDVAQFIADCTEKDVEDVAAIADLVYGKTLGNIFFVRCSLEELVRKNVLYFDIISYEWQYNPVNNRTAINSFVNDDFGHMIISKIEGMGNNEKQALILAAYTSSTIDVGTLQILLNAKHIMGIVSKMLERAVSEGLLLKSRRLGPEEYTFAHDLVQEALYKCVQPGNERNHLLAFIGKILGSRYTSTGQEWMLFVAVHHLNSVPREYMKEYDMPPEKLAQMNLQVAEFASSKADVPQAANFLRSGVKWLESNGGWKRHYDLRLDLYNNLLLAEFSLGNYDKAEAAIEQVLRNAACLGDKAVAHLHLIKVGAEKNDRDYNIGVEMGIKVLKEYGRELPLEPSKLYVVAAKTRVLLKRRGRPLMGLAKRPVMEDNAVMRLYNETQRYANMTSRFPLSGVILYRAIRIAYSDGISPDLGHIAANGIVRLMRMGKIKSALSYGRLSEEVLKRFPEEQSGPEYAEFRFKIKFCVGATMHPYGKDIDEFHEYYKTMISGGMVEMGLGSAMTYGLNYFAAGLPLSSFLARKLALYEHSSHELGQKSFTTIFMVFRQFVLNLLGASTTNPTLFDGVAFKEDEVLGPMEGNAKNMALRDVSTFRVQLAYIFCDETAMIEMVERLKSFPLFDLITARQHLRIAFLGLAAFALGNGEKKNKEYLKLGDNIMKEMRKLDKGGSVNAHPIHLCLQAAKSPTMSRYTMAIEACSSARMIHLEAMMNERCAEWLKKQNDEANSKTYMMRAFSCYSDWGAKAKTSQLCDRYSFLECAISEHSDKFRREVSSVKSAHDAASVYYLGVLS